MPPQALSADDARSRSPPGSVPSAPAPTAPPRFQSTRASAARPTAPPSRDHAPRPACAGDRPPGGRVVRVLVPTGQAEDSLAQQVPDRVPDLVRVPAVHQTGLPVRRTQTGRQLVG